MKRSFWIGLFIITIGCLLVALPDNDRRLITFNKDHGPSLMDGIGIMLIIFSWLLMMAQVFISRKKVYRLAGRKWLLVAVVLIIAGTIAVVTGLIYTENISLWTGIVVAVSGYSIIIPAAFKKTMG